MTTSSTQGAAQGQGRLVDPRGPRFGAAITTVVLAGILILGADSPFGVALLAWQTFAFALAAVFGLRASPYGVLYRAAVRPRLGRPGFMEEEAPPRFAQSVGLGFALVGLIGALAGLDLLFVIAVGAALAAAFLNAAFAYCLGCEVYLLLRRLGRKNQERVSAA